jgi:hypothetical protein
MKAVHKPTGKPCTIVHFGLERCFCDFGPANNPFTYVDTIELEFEDPKKEAPQCPP